MKKILTGAVFFIGWILSPFTWWNDAFINMPLSYLMANFIFFITRLPFKWLVIGSYGVTNILGIFLMYFGGKGLIINSKNRVKTAITLVILLFIYSAVMIYMDKKGKLVPL